MNGFRLRGMNVNEVAPKTNNPRLNKIRAVSLLVQTLLWVWLALGIYFLLCFVVLPPTKISDVTSGVEGVRLSIWSTELPLAMLALLAVKMVLGIICLVATLRLVRLYGRGIYFSPKNVIYIKLFGGWLILDWVMDFFIQRWEQNAGFSGGWVTPSVVSVTPVFVGLLIIYVAWIMDEGRKIQEEQELTV